jgi:hypothetical protein
VTGSHVFLTIAFTLTQVWVPYSKTLIQAYRIETAYYLFGGAADLFLSLMLWFILDTEMVPALFEAGNRVYAVTEVIRQTDSSSFASSS